MQTFAGALDGAFAAEHRPFCIGNPFVRLVASIDAGLRLGGKLIFDPDQLGWLRFGEIRKGRRVDIVYSGNEFLLLLFELARRSP